LAIATETGGAARRRRGRPETHLFFFAAFALLLLLVHFPFLDLPFYWDEAGQFVPAALDLYERGAWVPERATPNVHPPGVMAYLALVWRVFGYSITATRVAMLAAAAVGLWLAFLLAIRLCRKVGGAPAFSAVLLLTVSPLFYTQSMLAQLDMPAMLLTVCALLLFLDGRVRAAALASAALVLVKETGVVVPLVLAAWLIAERRPKEAAWFVLPLAALAAWLAVLWKATGHPFGNPEFARYNLAFAVHPVRILMALARRCFYLFVENFHWVGWIAVLAAWRRARIYSSRPWRVAISIAVAQVLAVTVLGGATLERYLLPVLPLLYIAFAAAWSSFPSLGTRVGKVVTFAGLVFCLFWNPPYPQPFENNLAMVDFVRLHEWAGDFLERNLPGQTVTTAWPLWVELRRPTLGYVHNKLAVREIPSFRAADVGALDPASVEVFVLFSREWERDWDLRRAPLVSGLMRRFYGYEPQITPAALERRLGVELVARRAERGQWVAVYRKAAHR